MALFRTSNLPKKGYIFPIRVIVPFDQYLNDDYVHRIKQSISLRSTPEEANNQINQLKSYQPLMRQILELRPKKENLVTMMGAIEDNLGDTNSYFTNVRPDQSHLVKDLEDLEKELSSLEDQVIPFLLRLPNELDEEVESKGSADGQYFTVLEEVTRPRPKFKLLDSVKLSYINFGQHTAIIGPTSQFITAEGAKLHIALTRYFSSSLLEADYIPFVGLDIVKSCVIQACDVERGDKVFMDPLIIAQGDDADSQNNYIHLVGESAFEAIASMLNRRDINPECLPIRFSSIGSNYSSTLNQFHAINCVTLTTNDPAASASETQSMVSLIWSLYKKLGLPCRLIKCSGLMLKSNESSRYEIQVWMPTSSEWKTSGYIANHRDYTTKRLGREGYSIINGSLINCETVVASLMENNQQEDGSFEIPDLLRQQLIPK